MSNTKKTTQSSKTVTPSNGKLTKEQRAEISRQNGRKSKNGGRPTKKEQHYKKVGRKVFDGKDKDTVIAKLEEAARIDAPIDEMCFYADISRDSYYRYIKKNPKFRNRIEQLRQRLPLKSRQNIALAIENQDISLSKWMLERKRPDEFSETINVNENIETSDDEEVVLEFRKKLKMNLKERVKENARKNGELKEDEIQRENSTN